jgi:hypothetical protein
MTSRTKISYPKPIVLSDLKKAEYYFLVRQEIIKERRRLKRYFSSRWV